MFNFNWLFLDKIIRIFGGLFIGIWVARYLGPQRYGILSYAMAFVAFFSFIATLGLNSIVIREITRYEENYQKIIGTTFYLKLIGGVIAFICGTIVIFTFKTDDSTTKIIVILLLCGYILQAMDAVDYFFQAQVLSKYIVLAKSMAFVVSSGIKVFLIVAQFSVEYFAIASLVDVLLASVFMFLIYKRLNYSTESWKLDTSLAKKLLQDSWPLMLSVFFITIYIKIDQVMIEHYLDMQSVGLYSVAVRLCEAWYFIPTIIVSTIMPYFIKIHQTSRDLFLFRLRQINTFMFWMSIVVGVVITLIGEDLIVFLFTNVYKDAFLALALNIWVGVFVSIGLSTNLWVISENLQIYRLIGTAIGVVLNIVANYMLIPMYGISGAAVATLITQGLGLWVIPFFFKPMRLYILISITSIIPIYMLKEKK